MKKRGPVSLMPIIQVPAYSFFVSPVA